MTVFDKNDKSTYIEALDKLDKEMSPKHIAFCEAYLISYNGTKAYMKVYPDCAIGSARALACKLLVNNNIQTYISIRQQEIKEEANITNEEIIQVTKEIMHESKNEKNKLKAVELLSKRIPEFSEKVETKLEVIYREPEPKKDE